MFPTRVALSKASRVPLTSKRGPKDFYKGKYAISFLCHLLTVFTGNRQSSLPGGPRTGPPGKHVIRGKAKYRIVDEQVRVFVAPPIEKINNSPVRFRLSTNPIINLCPS